MNPRRLEDPRFLTGQGWFVGDVVFAGMVEAAIVRSPYAHARLVSCDVDEARHRPGVMAVLTARDLPRPVPVIPVRLSPAPELEQALQPVLAFDRVRYVGEPVAVVIAKNRYLAEDALDAVRVRYQPCPAVTRAAGLVEQPLLHDGVPGNRVYQRRTSKGDPKAAMAAAPHRLSLSFSIQRHSGVPLETRGLVARPVARRLEVYGPTKVVHFNRRILASLLGVPIEELRFVEPDVGGGFGIRGEFYPEDFLIPYAARLLQRPVKWIEDRGEHLKAANHSRQQHHQVEIGFDDEGRLLALRDTIWVDSGAYSRTHGVTVPELTQAMLPGPYVWPALEIDLNVALTNKTPTGTYRGPGRFEGTFVRERAIDAVAQVLKRDPADVRRRNLIPTSAMPYSNSIAALGQEVVFDTGDYAKALDRALALMDYAWFEARRMASAQNGRLRGFGMAFFVEKSGLGPWEMARVRMTPEGAFECFSGLAALGQGTGTMLAQVVSSVLGVDLEQIRVIHGDTDAVPEGNGSFASRGTVVGGAAAHVSATVLSTRIREAAAHLLEASGEDMVLDSHGAFVQGVPTRSVTYAAIYQEALAANIALDVEERYEANHMTYPYGVHCAEVEVDPATGAVRIVRYGIVYDIGKAILPKLVEGQIVGGIAQGLGGAVLEELAYDVDGQLLSASFMDYMLPGAPEVPDITVLITEDAPALTNPLGAKGSGEGGVVGVAPALANAVARAVGAPPEAFSELPLTPQRVLGWIKRTEGGSL